MVATPSDALRQRLIDLANTESPPVITPGRAGRVKELERREARDAAAFFEIIQTALETQQRAAELAQTAQALEEATLMALLEAEERLAETRRMANRAKDGRRVYETEDGHAIYDEKGREVGWSEIDRRTWNSDGPTWERYNQEVVDVDATRQFHARIQEQKERLEGNPSSNDLDEIEEALDELERDMPANVRAHYNRLVGQASKPRATSAAETYTGRSGFISAAEMGNAFTGAAKERVTSDEAAEAAPDTAPQPPGGDLRL